MKYLRRTLLALIFALSFVSMLTAREYTRSTDKVTVTMFTNFDKVHPGQNLEVLIKFTMHNGWHIFSQNPGDIGIPTAVKWSLPLGYEVKDEVWSIDRKFVNEGIEQFGYDKTAYYKAVIVTGGDVLGDAKLKAEVSWLACRDECIPEKVSIFAALPITEQDLQPNVQWNKVMQTAEHSFVPKILEMDVNLWLAVLMAFAGGLILNFMPCIFPILTIKAISLAQSPYNRKKSRIEALLYTLGVVVSFLVIATVLVILRAQGEQIGWGFQLQSPIFVSIMIVIFFIIFLMLLDVITFRNPLGNKVGRISFKRQMLNSFMTGFFAVLIASPCTAPFMGIAIGYTLTAPVYIYYPVFLALSLGYALPFALVGLFPKAVHKILPRPGKWMDILKKIFAIPVLLTCFWLIWLLYNQVEVQRDAVVNSVRWENYNSVKVADLVEKKEPVFIDFTAKWCITCLVNKKVALQSDAFAKLTKEHNIHLFRADWTNNDETIAAALERYGRNSIPLYIFYRGDSPNYKVLPQILTPGILEDYLK